MDYDYETDQAWEDFKRRNFCPNDGAALRESTDPNLPGCLECPLCGFVQGFGVIGVGVSNVH